MSTRFDLGVVTAYAYAVEGGYTGTEAEFTALLGNIALDLEQIENLSVTVETLPAGSSATASYADGVLSLGIPKGDKGDKGNTGATGPTGATPDISIGTVTTGAVGSDAAATMTGTPEHPVLNLTLPRGATGDVTNLADTFSSSKAYTAGEYVIYNDLLYVFTANHAAGAWNASHVSQVKVGGELTGLKEDLNRVNERFDYQSVFQFSNPSFDSIFDNLGSWIHINKRTERQLYISTTDASVGQFFLPLDLEIGVDYAVTFTFNGTTGTVGDNPNVRLYNGDVYISMFDSGAVKHIRKNNENDDYKVRFYLSKSSTLSITDCDSRQSGVNDTLKMANMPQLSIAPKDTTFFDLKNIFKFTDSDYDSIFASIGYWGHFSLREDTKLFGYTDDVHSITLKLPLDLQVGINYVFNFSFSYVAGYVGDNPNIRVYKNGSPYYQLSSGVDQVVKRTSENDTFELWVYIARKSSLNITNCDVRIQGEKDVIKEEYLPPSLRNQETVYSVKDFGAVCDGVTDDSDAIQLALNSIPYGSTLLIERCALTKPITISKVVKLKGTNALHGNYTGNYSASQLYFKGNTNISTYCINTSAPIEIEDLIIHSYNTPSNAYLIQASNASVLMRNCVLQGANGLKVNNGYYCKLSNSFFYITNKAISITNCYTFCGVNTAFNADNVFELNDSSVVNLQNCSLESYTTGVAINSGSVFNADMCYFEPILGATTMAVKVDDNSSVVISRAHVYVKTGYFIYDIGDKTKVISENNNIVYGNPIAVYYIDGTGVTAHISGDNWDDNIADDVYAVLNSSTGDIEIKYPYGNSNYA